MVSNKGTPWHPHCSISISVATWQNECKDICIYTLSCSGRKLVSDRTAKSKLDAVRIAESQFVDGLALYTYTSGRDKLENVSIGFVRGD